MVSYLALLAAATAFSFTVGAQLLAIMPLDDTVRAAFRAIPGTAPAILADPTKSTTASWIAQLVPTNPLRAAVEDNYLGVVVTTLLFGLAMTRISTDKRTALATVIEAIAETSSVLIGWIIRLLPVAAFALAFTIATSSGLAIAGAVTWFVVGVSLLLIACTLLLYPVTVLLGRVSFREFASAAAPSQTIAAGTRSSLACLPPLLEGAERLQLPPEVSGFVLPLSVSTFKINPGITQPFELLFYIYIFDLHLSPAFFVTFAVTTIVMAFTSAGVPSGGRLLSWPMYLAAGVPVQALVVTKVADAIPDIFKTVANVTADLSVATIVTRFFKAEQPARIVTAASEAA
jgi:proton glutamate symport protein